MTDDSELDDAVTTPERGGPRANGVLPVQRVATGHGELSDPGRIVQLAAVEQIGELP